MLDKFPKETTDKGIDFTGIFLKSALCFYFQITHLVKKR